MKFPGAPPENPNSPLKVPAEPVGGPAPPVRPVLTGAAPLRLLHAPLRSRGLLPLPPPARGSPRARSDPAAAVGCAVPGRRGRCGGGEGGSGRRSQTRPWRRRRKRCSCGGRKGWERRKEGEGWVRTERWGGELSQRQQVFQGDRCPQLHARGSPVAIAGSGRLGIGDGGRDAGTGRGGGGRGGGRKRRGWQKDETYVLRPLPSAEPQLRRLAAVPPPNSCSGRGEPKSKAPPRKKITMQSGTAHGKDLFLSPDIAPPAAHPQKESKTVPTSPPNTYTPNTFQPFASLTAGNGPAAHRGAPQPAWSSPGPPSAAGGAQGAQPPPAAAASSCRQGPY